APLDDIDTEAIANDYEIGTHSKKHGLKHHRKVATLEGIDPTDSLAELATKTATHNSPQIRKTMRLRFRVIPPPSYRL
ncbi:MAG: hypothetical protein ABEJ44_07575, partial [Halanaeroarchaeum sp.]